MATNSDITIRAGRTYTITDTVSGISDWTNKKAVLSIARKLDQTPDLTVDGTVDSGNDKVQFDLSATQTAELSGVYHYEITIYLDDRTFVKDSSYGKLVVKSTIDEDPTD